MKYVLFIFCAFIFLSACSHSNTQTPNEDQNDREKNITMKDVMYMEGENSAMGYLAKPEGEGPFPAVLLIHEWWGLNENIRQNAERFAEEGYAALAVDLYNGSSATDPDDARKLATSVREDMDSAFENLTSAIAYLQDLPSVDANRMASVGWCFGGGWSYEIAKNNLGVQSSVIYYGQFNPEDDLSQMRAKILGHFGEEDASIQVDTVKEFQATLQTLSGYHEVYIYPNSGHAFANQDNDNYNEQSANTAWERTLNFLNLHVKAKTLTVEADNTWYGSVLVRGYPEVVQIIDPQCTEDCEKEEVQFHLLQTSRPDFKEVLETHSELFAQPNTLRLGCVSEGKIKYSNFSDDGEGVPILESAQDSPVEIVQGFFLNSETSSAILDATQESPIALKLKRLRLSEEPEEYPVCYSHFTTMGVL